MISGSISFKLLPVLETILNFIKDRFDGKAISGCEIRNETLDALYSLPTFASFAGAYNGDLAGILDRTLEPIILAGLLGS